MTDKSKDITESGSAISAEDNLSSVEDSKESRLPQSSTDGQNPEEQSETSDVQTTDRNIGVSPSDEGPSDLLSSADNSSVTDSPQKENQANAGTNPQKHPTKPSDSQPKQEDNNSNTDGNKSRSDASNEKIRKQREQEAVDKNQEEYRKKFGIVDKYLIGYSYDPRIEEVNGYIVFIDYENDLDYIDCQAHSDDENKKIQECIAKLQHAEAAQTKHLPESQQMDFKRMLGVGYIQALNGNYDGVEDIIKEAKVYLKKRNREHSRFLFLSSGLPAAIVALTVGFFLYYFDNHNSWYFGIIFGILGAFVSIWTRYGKVQFTGQARSMLHILECYSRIIIGSIFSLIAMTAIKCQLILPELTGSNRTGKEQLFTFILVSFVAAFSERFIPSIVERITNESTNIE